MQKPVETWKSSRQGALLLVENGQLLHVELPKEGVNVEVFFETSKVRENLV